MDDEDEAPSIIFDQPGDGGAWFVYHNSPYFSRHSKPYVRVDHHSHIQSGERYPLSNVRCEGCTIVWTVDGPQLNGKPAHFTVGCFNTPRDAMKAFSAFFGMRRKRNASFSS